MTPEETMKPKKVMTPEEAIEYLELALKRSSEEAVYQLVAKVGTKFLDCMKDNVVAYDQRIDKNTISTTDKLALYGPYTTLKKGACHGPKPLNPLSEAAWKYSKWKEVSDLNKSKPELQHMYIETLKTVFAKAIANDTALARKMAIKIGKPKGMDKFCATLTHERFAMLKADPKEESKEKVESQSTATKPMATSESISSLSTPMTVLSSVSLADTGPTSSAGPKLPPSGPLSASSDFMPAPVLMSSLNPLTTTAAPLTSSSASSPAPLTAAFSALSLSQAPLVAAPTKATGPDAKPPT